MQPWPAALEKTLRRLHAAGIHAYVVGGAVRDRVLGRETRDFDVLVEAPLEAAYRALPEAAWIRARTPVLALGGDGDPRIEITPLRDCSLEENLALRDFTLNAMALDPVSGTLQDPHGGRVHLEGRRLVAVRPERGFRDDPVRILRGVRLAFELGLEIEAETELAMGRDAFLLDAAPGERLRDELVRVLHRPEPSGPLERLRTVGALAVVLPEVVRMVGVEQNRWHPDDVYRHTLRVVDRVPAGTELRLAALLHDTAKPETKRFSKRRGDFSFLRHEHRARRHVARVAARLRLSRRQETTIARLVRHHLLAPESLQTDRAIGRMLGRVGDDILDALIELRRADLASRTPSGRSPAEWEAAVERIRALRARTARAEGTPLAICGRDVIRALGIPEGPEVGRWLRRARRQVLEKPERNSREWLLRWLERSTRGESG